MPPFPKEPEKFSPSPIPPTQPLSPHSPVKTNPFARCHPHSRPFVSGSLPSSAPLSPFSFRPLSLPHIFFFNLLSFGQSLCQQAALGLLPVSRSHCGLCAGGVCPIPFLSPGSGYTCSGIGGECWLCCSSQSTAKEGESVSLSPPPLPLVVCSAAHSCQVCCGDELVKSMFFFKPPFVLSPGECERCLASHSSSDGHPSPHPTTSSQCGFPFSPSLPLFPLGP